MGSRIDSNGKTASQQIAKLNSLFTKELIFRLFLSFRNNPVVIYFYLNS